MTINELKDVVMGIEGAVKGRRNKTNFVIVPVEDGYATIEVKRPATTDGKNRTAFNYDAAVAEYKAWEAEAALREAERAAKPKTPKGPNPEAQARRDELDAKVAGLPSFTEYTATDIYNALAGQIGEKTLPMHIGASAKRLVEKGILTVTTHEGDKKSYYTKA